MDWTGCKLVERVEERCSGVPTVVGTRVFPDAIVDDYQLGSPVDEIQENYPHLSRVTIEGLIAFAQEQQRKQSA